MELYYSCSENKGADQLRSHCKADLRLCFRICTFPHDADYYLKKKSKSKAKEKKNVFQGEECYAGILSPISN